MLWTKAPCESIGLIVEFVAKIIEVSSVMRQPSNMSLGRCQIMSAGALRIGLVLTGGTVGSEYSADEIVRIPRSNDNHWAAELDLISKAWGQRGELELHPCQPLQVLSENMVPQDWLLIAADMRQLIVQHDIAGFLILHGTDTACYTAVG
jgi:L-asparaginase/Glu-tRNA(Gln) amidotransferase subunit D